VNSAVSCAESKVGRIFRNTATVGAFTALSRVLGMVREMLQSRMIGAGVEQSAFTLAFAIPNMARKLFGEGALTAAFVPVFKAEMETGAREKAERLARAVMTMALTMLAAVTAIALLGLEAAEAWWRGCELSGRAVLTVGLVKTLLPYMIFICGAAFGMGVLNALGRFRASSAMPCLLNVFWIGILVWLCFNPELRLDERIRRVAAAILAAGAAQFLFMAWRMRVAGVRPWPLFAGWRDGGVRRVWRNTAVAAVGAGAIQINYMLDQVLAQCAAPWAAGVIGYAERLMDLPLGIIGVAFGTVLLPAFAGFFAKDDLDGARGALVSSLRGLMLVMLPSAAGLFALSPEVTSVIYQGRAFDELAVLRVSRSVAVYALGLGLFGFQKSLVPWFQAQNDMKTPLRVSLCTVAMNATLNVLAVVCLPVEWRHVGLAASTVFCAGAGCIMLGTAARRKNGRLGLSALAADILKIALASAAMAAALQFSKPFFAGIGKVAALAAEIALGAAVYGALIVLSRVEIAGRFVKAGRKA
jgi:putative peptidoglycan lipid II flippase